MKTISFILASFILVVVGFLVAKPVEAAQTANSFRILPIKVIDYTASSKGTILDNADLQKMQQLGVDCNINTTSCYQTQAAWPQVNAGNGVARLSFIFKPSDLAKFRNGTWQKLIINNQFALNDSSNLFPSDHYDVVINGQEHWLSGSALHDVDLTNLINSVPMITSLRVDFYLVGIKQNANFFSYHNYFDLQGQFNFNSSVNLLSPINNVSLNQNQPEFNWQINNPGGLDLRSRIKIFNANGKVIFDKSVGTNQSFTLTNALADGNYSWWVILSQDGGKTWLIPSASANFAIKTTTVKNTALTAPVISASQQNGQITVSWNQVAGATGYDVYRNGSLVGTTNLLMFVDGNLTRGQNYIYQVKAIDVVGDQSSFSNAVTIYLLNPQISSISFLGALGITTTPQVSSLTPQVQAKSAESSGPANSTSSASQAATNWAWVIAIILVGLLILGGGLYWWYSREEDEI